MIRKFYLTLPLFLFFTACQNKSDIYVENTLYKTKPLVLEKEATLEYEPIINPKEYKELLEEDDTLSKNDAIDMNKQFMDFYNEWKHVKYRFGGNSKKGIDCSAFTQRIYKEKFDIKIPRSTRTQVKVGTEVAKSELELGDLIFFKTGKVDRHVGVYMGNGDFMHASIKGVKFSKVDKPFYKKTYWTSRRIID
ncbi:C40 family peptidase [Poseidonibacter lekithochrous]|jgi:lipoprotein Spr|uniref:NlpC/P60 family protein n=1 Tax=Poseidonibacter TaxID=2321187 RepID=UPI001C0A54EC|nr:MULTISPECIES: NlpC/P60 family protein [Poseidonibacter]MBU3014540.1 C40 family peptidase [Poseidonibacter lekithochrous]MDO6827838.1 NlpC/P60 family protein [Poseidonibacter sp. 1_MG-2023]